MAARYCKQEQYNERLSLHHTKGFESKRTPLQERCPFVLINNYLLAHLCKSRFNVLLENINGLSAFDQDGLFFTVYGVGHNE